MGWNENNLGTGASYSATAPLGTFAITSDKTLYAEWESSASCATNATVTAGSLKGSILQTNPRQSFYHLCDSLFSYLHYVKDRIFCSYQVLNMTLYFTKNGNPLFSGLPLNLALGAKYLNRFY